MNGRARVYWAIVVGALSIASPASAQSGVTADDIVAACAEAMGGAEAIDALATLRVGYRLPDHGGASQAEIKRPNLFRAGSLVFDGQEAAVVEPQEQGGFSIEILNSEEFKDFEMEIGWFFPAFFDYPAAYRGVEYIDGIGAHKLEVHLPLGARLTYYIDAETYLPMMLESRVWLNGNDHRYQRMFGDYRNVNGINYPHSFTYFSHHRKVMYVVTLDQVKINAPLEEGHFAVPEEKS